jgi:transposase-like protein
MSNRKQKAETTTETAIVGNTVLAVVLCPDCEKKVKLISDMNTDWYGNLKYYRCRNCKETFVSQNGGELEIAAH